MNSRSLYFDSHKLSARYNPGLINLKGNINLLYLKTEWWTEKRMIFKPQIRSKPQTWPRDAAATGSAEISEKSISIGTPSSSSIILKATSVEKGAIRSCKRDSSSRYVGGIISYKEEPISRHSQFCKIIFKSISIQSSGMHNIEWSLNMNVLV